MTEYIERDAILREIERREALMVGDKLVSVDAMKSFIKNRPAADVVEVVRCKDCIRRYDTDECPMCFLIEGKYYEHTNENGFCDRGERKEGAE